MKMQIRNYLTLLVLGISLSCSDDNPDGQQANLTVGNLEVLVISTDNEPLEGAIVTTFPQTEELTTGPLGTVLFRDINIGEYEVSALLPAFVIPTIETITVVAGTTTRIEIITGPDPIEPTPLNIDFLLQQSYESLKGPNLFDATGYSYYWGDIGSDILYGSPSLTTNIVNLDRYNLNPGDRLIEDVWTDHYRAIRLCNMGIEAIENMDYVSDQGINESIVLGEFRFLRAVLYFNLVKIYGNPVLVTSTIIDLDNPPETVQDPLKVYELIEEDLLFAEANLDASGPSNQASIAAAQALLGKVYLQMAGFPLLQNDKYAQALTQFKKLEGVFALETNYSDIFSLANEGTNGEVIFSIDFDFAMENGGNYGVNWGPLGISQQDYLWLVPGFPEYYFTMPDAVTSPVTFPIENQDSRFFQNIATFSLQNGTMEDEEEIDNWRPYKFQKDITLSTNPNEESFDFPYLRYADVLLMLAEAENAVNGPTALAYDAINQVRRRAFGNTENDVAPGLDQQEFLEVLLEERRLELCYEGARKDDLIRTQNLQGVIDSFNQNNAQSFKDYQAHEYIWPIPQVEINLNPGAVQNPGY
ncbi:RagB/SusD family nutrient uptake outer membrane protein [Ulvibacterium sp.]|uniref:RagB/SusD family nutrient uptake outer membrane protein n=1 Tax=Ulvibacterium sp. TaxID=2665914 RepID=UPI003CC589AD